MSTSFDIGERGEWIFGLGLRFKGVSGDHAVTLVAMMTWWGPDLAYALFALFQVKRMVPTCNKDKKESLVAGGIPRNALIYGDAGWELRVKCECCVPVSAPAFFFYF